ncbi:MAG: glycoside hydrolase family 15 protein [Acidimicrobiia bacterium]|nr:glycoside hydrolase family 15 protein [Acidimicrobiia bacterium]
MAGRIEDYALIGDTETAALVCNDGSIDFWAAPRFDSPTVFCALLGTADHGHWQIAPTEALPDGATPGGAPTAEDAAEEPRTVGLEQATTVTRSYRRDTMVLETVFETPTGSVALIDFMPIRSHHPSVVRIVEGRSGSVRCSSHLTIRFDYGSIVPWVRSVNGGITAVGGADAATLHSDVDMHGEDLATVGEFTVDEGDRFTFSLTWHPSHQPPPHAFDAHASLDRTEGWWRDWLRRCSYQGPWADHVHRSLLVLKALTYAPTGGIVAAATTSLPEEIGGERNWDYRYCWLRDASFTLTAFLDAGYEREAMAWGRWLRRAVAGSPSDLQIMYGVGGERRLTELELSWLPGYRESTPVRIGNGAHDQLQLDVYGEVLDLFHTLIARRGRLSSDGFDTGRALMEHLATIWDQPDDGLWEVRGQRQHFVHSKVMAWVAVDRWVRIIEMLHLDEDLDRWRHLASEIHHDVCTKGWSDERGSFTQAYGSTALDASLLLIPIVGFLPADDERVVATVEAIHADLDHHGFLLRYRTDHTDDGLEGEEGTFLLTTFWLVEALALMGRTDEATELFERCISVTNDVGLLSEEYDPVNEHQLGNVPQAFSHLGLIISAFTLTGDRAGPAFRRCGMTPEPTDPEVEPDDS